MKRKNNNFYTSDEIFYYLHIIKLGEEFISKIDKEDYYEVRKYAWKISTSGYVTRSTEPRNLHRLIFPVHKNQIIDHINRNRLDNTKKNLRIITKSQNGINSDRKKISSTGFRGVYWDKRSKKYISSISVQHKPMHQEYFTDLKQAVRHRKMLETIYEYDKIKIYK